MLGISTSNGRFEFGKKIGSGSFGSVYYGFDTKKNTEVAIKVESSRCRVPQLEYEARLYKVLGSIRGLPTLIWHGQEAGCNLMVLNLLGPCLQDLLHFCRPACSLKTVLQIGSQVLDVLEYVHSLCFIHRDIKPANFLVGRGEDASTVYLIDFGLAKRYWSAKADSHISFRMRKTRGLVGSARYASRNAHQGYELSRRDDLESLGYMLLHMIKGTLPWLRVGADHEDREAKNARIGMLKHETKWEELCYGLPPIFGSFLMQAYCLEFEHKPDYALMARFLKVTAAREDIVYDWTFDWTQRRADGEVVEHAEEDDRQSCNLSQTSMDSAGDTSGVLGQLGMAPKPGNSSECSSRAAAGAPASGTIPVQGPLARLVVKNARKEDKPDASDLVRVMQTAGVADGSFWQSIKKMGVGPESVGTQEAPAEGSDKPQSQGKEAGATTV